MASKKLKSVTLEWLDKNLWTKLRDPLRDRDTTLNEVEAEINKLKQSPTSLPANCLELEESLQMFGLAYNPLFTAWSLKTHEHYELPPLLTAIMDEHKFATQGSVFNEALARSTLNNILIISIAEEKRLAIGHSQSNLMLSAQSPSRSTTPAPDSDPAPLFLKFETKLSFEVTFNKEERLLQGFADYSLWYDKDEPMGTNLLLVEAKRRNALSSADGQLVAYMGIVHRIRETHQKRNKIVFGLSTDGNQFQFWRLDNSSQLTHSRIYDWNGGDGSKIISYIRIIIRAAIHLSPSTFPIKDKVQREVSLRAFNDTDRIKSFDYNFGRLKEDYDGDVEIVDLPDIL